MSLRETRIELLNEEDNTYSSSGHDILKPLQQLRDVGIDTICSWERFSISIITSSRKMRK